MVKQKKAAMELSIGTVVVLVLAMAMLVLGGVLVKKIFFGATESVDELTGKVRNQIADLFAKGDSNIIIKLGSDKSADVKQGDVDYGIAFGATPENGVVDRNSFKYKLTLDRESPGNCIEKLGERTVEKFFLKPIGPPVSFTTSEKSIAFARIGVTIPAGTQKCSQAVIIDTYENGQPTGYFDTFTIRIVSKGFF
ncbi:hypothetical protein GOV14_00160 [Candidatus Pacearchaeota archaeon]|nr:hypothetical protein [Candidatus Pacearchaeota archaeon]